jgi:hypothetical protein
MTENEITLLHNELQRLESAANVLSEIMFICKSIGLGRDYSLVELIHLEALMSRFAKLSDLLIRKIFRLIDKLDYEPQETIRDSINRAEKIGLIESAAIFSVIRETRNAIAHEYILEDLSGLYKDVFDCTPLLLDTVERVKKYCTRYS